MNRLTFVSACVLFIAGFSFATNRYYNDLKGRSQNGQYEATATSPANQYGKRQTPFQRDFIVTFSDTQSGKTLWTWKQGEEDLSPVELIPTDCGQLIMRTIHDYHVFDAAGVKTKVFEPLRSLSKAEQETFTDWTTAGTQWRQYSQQGFISFENKTYFYLRLYWGRTFIIDLSQAELITETKVAERVEQHILEQTRNLIETFNWDYYAKCDSCNKNHLRAGLTEAAFVIKKHTIREGEKLLNEVLDKSDDGRNSHLADYLDRVKSAQ